MTSADLGKRGFGGWTVFNRRNESAVLAGLPADPGVYCIRCDQTFSLTKGSSDILYIGSAANRGGLQGRVRQYFHPGPTQWTNKRLLTRGGDSEDYEIGVLVCGSGQSAKDLEADLLEAFIREHGQLPPENRQPGRGSSARSRKKAQRMFDAVARAPMSGRTRAKLTDFVSSGDCDGLLRYLEECVATQRDVGRSIQRAGQVSFEARLPLVRKIHAEG